jgi:hypothetical protein
MAKSARKPYEKKTVFKNKTEVIECLEKTFDNVTAKAVIDKKRNIIHEFFSNETKIAHTEYLYTDKKDEDQINYKHKLVLE